jgi:hypothetical protein
MNREDAKQLIEVVIDKAKCLYGYDVSTVIGRGQEGFVYSVMHKKKEYAVKILQIKWYISKFENEVKVGKAFSKVGIGPTIYASCIATLSDDLKFGIIIMEKLDGNVQDLIDMNPIPISQHDFSTKLWHILYTMKRNNMSHYDLKLINIGYKVQPNGDYQFKCIDFSHSDDTQFNKDLILRAFNYYFFITEQVNHEYLSEFSSYKYVSETLDAYEVVAERQESKSRTSTCVVS